MCSYKGAKSWDDRVVKLICTHLQNPVQLATRVCIHVGRKEQPGKRTNAKSNESSRLLERKVSRGISMRHDVSMMRIVTRLSND